MAVWIKVPSDEPANAYYWNVQTGATVWKLPPGVEVEWVAQKTNKSKDGEKMYYWNKRTRETTWDLESLTGTRATSSKASPSPTEAVNRPTEFVFEVFPQYSGDRYDANGQENLEVPPFYYGDADPGGTGGDWIEVNDHESSGERVYYMNYTQGVSQWSLPPGQTVTWRAFQHASGSWYYVHASSAKATWTVPDMLGVSQRADCADDSLHARWIECGACMMVDKLSSGNSRFNKQVGNVLGYNAEGRVMFQLPDCHGNLILLLRPRKLFPLEMFCIVELRSITKKPELNGLFGRVTAVDQEKCRYTVTVHHADSTSTQHSVRAPKVQARSRLWDLEISNAPSWLQWRKDEQECIFVDSEGNHRRFSIHLPLRFMQAAEDAGCRRIRWPLLVYMHGAGGTSYFKHSKKSLQSAGLHYCADNFVVVSPSCDWNWKEKPKPWVTELVLSLRAADWVDHRRVYLSGCSMGGMGSWEVGAARPELYAAISPVAGHHNAERTDTIGRQLRSTPVLVVHSLHDGVCPHLKEMPLWNLLREEGNEFLKVCLAYNVDHTYMYERAFCDDATLYRWLLRWQAPEA